jgi:hypothetical protein
MEGNVVERSGRRKGERRRQHGEEIGILKIKT